MHRPQSLGRSGAKLGPDSRGACACCLLALLGRLLQPHGLDLLLALRTIEALALLRSRAGSDVALPDPLRAALPKRSLHELLAGGLLSARLRHQAHGLQLLGCGQVDLVVGDQDIRAKHPQAWAFRWENHRASRVHLFHLSRDDSSRADPKAAQVPRPCATPEAFNCGGFRTSEQEKTHVLLLCQRATLQRATLPPILD